MYICKCCEFKVYKTNNESRDKSVVSCYIETVIEALSNRLVSLMRFIKMSNVSDGRIDLSSLDQMTGQAMYSIGNSPKPRDGEIRRLQESTCV